MGLNHRELLLEGKCDEAAGQKIKQCIYQLAECIQLKPVQATKLHLLDSISVHSSMKQRTVLSLRELLYTFWPRAISQNYLSITIDIFTCLYVFTLMCSYDDLTV